MEFDVVVGNPPYQKDNMDNNRTSPVYQCFYDLAEKCSSKYCLISPARFLFNAGQTPKEWNAKMLNDSHLEVVYFNHKSSEVFANTDIKGGVAILYRDTDKNFEPIETFTSFNELKVIMNKVSSFDNFTDIGEIVYARSSYKFTNKLLQDRPELQGRAKGNEARSMGSNVFDRYPEIFFESRQDVDQVQIYGRQNNKRVYKYVNYDYIQDGGNLDGWKVFVAKSNGSGALGEVLSTPVVGEPLIGHTQTFISMGNFRTKTEAEALLKYLKSKFSRLMLSIKKVTQDNATKETWSKVPLQDFTAKSDIDWSQSVSEIDQQLYKKYGLNQDEITFIENKVKTMV